VRYRANVENGPQGGNALSSQAKLKIGSALVGKCADIFSSPRATLAAQTTTNRVEQRNFAEEQRFFVVEGAVQRGIADIGGKKACKLRPIGMAETTAQDLLKIKMSMLFNT